MIERSSCEYFFHKMTENFDFFIFASSKYLRPQDLIMIRAQLRTYTILTLRSWDLIYIILISWAFTIISEISSNITWMQVLRKLIFLRKCGRLLWNHMRSRIVKGILSNWDTGPEMHKSNIFFIKVRSKFKSPTNYFLLPRWAWRSRFYEILFV